MKQDDDKPAVEQFLALLQPLQQDLENYARRLLWDPQETPDALHNALQRAVGAFERCQEPARFRAWMFQILTREIFALNRKYARRARFEFQVEPEELETMADSSAEVASFPNWREALDDRLDLALKSLTEPERAVLLLRAIGGFKYEEIAQELAMPVGSVMGYLNRARKKMQAALLPRHAQIKPKP